MRTKHGDATYNFLFTPADHIEQLIKENKLIEADAVFSRERDFFVSEEKAKEPKGEKKREPSAPEKLAAAINKAIYPKAQLALENLPSIEDWPADVFKWKYFEGAISNAQDIINDYNGYLVFIDNISLPPIYFKLEEKIALLEETIVNSLDGIFRDYPLVDSPVFFSEFPIKDSLFNYLDGKNNVWISKIKGLATNELIEVFKDYKFWLTDHLKEETGKIYFEAYLSESGTKTRTALSGILRALDSTKSVGMPINQIEETRIALIEVTSRTLLKQGQIEFPTGIEIDLPFKYQKLDLDKALANPVAKTADIVLLIDIAAARIDRKISNHERINSKFQSGTMTIPNPEYNIVQNKVNNARLRVQETSMYYASVNSQWCQGIACIIKLASQIAAGNRVKEAKTFLGQMMNNLRNTPMTKDKPVYTPYQFTRSTLDVTKETTVNYHVINRNNNTYVRDTFDATQSRTFKVVYNLHEEDAKRYSHLASSVTEDDVVEFEKEEISVKISDLLDSYLDNPKKIRNLPTMANIRRQILKDKNKILAKFKSQQYEINPEKNDARFDSVVVVYHPGGAIGTGFFVRDDLILTNYHVIEGSRFVEMKMFNGQETFGKVINKDIRLDLALIKSQARGIPVTFFLKNTLPLGAAVDVIGHPSGLEFSISRGIISSLRKIESSFMAGGKKVLFIQTDAAINPGNSGGPLYLDRKVVGINTQKLAKTELEGLGFSVHYSEILKFLRQNDIKVGK